MSEEPKTSPTIETLNKQRGVENLSGSPLLKQHKLFGKEYSFYQDGSVLVVDPANNTFHFLTAEGRIKGSDFRGKAKGLIDKTTNLDALKQLGKGKGGFSKVYELATDSGPVAVKATDGAMFFFKEMMEEVTSKASDQTPSKILYGRMDSRIIVQKMSLKDTMQLFRKLDTAGVRKSEFYGFSVRRNASSNEIQEFQFMEKIDRPTIESIVEAAIDSNVLNGGTLSEDSFHYAGFVNEMAEKYYAGDQLALMRALVRSFIEFVADTKRRIPHIADLEMDNIFLAGFNEEVQKPEFLLIDPIEEAIYLRPITLTPTNSAMINLNKPLKINY